MGGGLIELAKGLGRIHGFSASRLRSILGEGSVCGHLVLKEGRGLPAYVRYVTA